MLNLLITWVQTKILFRLREFRTPVELEASLTPEDSFDTSCDTGTTPRSKWWSLSSGYDALFLWHDSGSDTEQPL